MNKTLHGQESSSRERFHMEGLCNCDYSASRGILFKRDSASRGFQSIVIFFLQFLRQWKCSLMQTPQTPKPPSQPRKRERILGKNQLLILFWVTILKVDIGTALEKGYYIIIGETSLIKKQNRLRGNFSPLFLLNCPTVNYHSQYCRQHTYDGLCRQDWIK